MYFVSADKDGLKLGESLGTADPSFSNTTTMSHVHVKIKAILRRARGSLVGLPFGRHRHAGDGRTSQQTQNICITFIQHRPNVEDVGTMLYICLQIFRV